ncbi:MAG: hypothetical protein M0R80_07755 [Proteobacteria bacterium]|jgi:hypothetical protein|nr:hypothetical protein [Pseudomonadota bacterium]
MNDRLPKWMEDIVARVEATGEEWAKRHKDAEDLIKEIQEIYAQWDSSAEFKVAMQAIESVILNHSGLGIDVSDPIYVLGIRNALTFMYDQVS